MNSAFTFLTGYSLEEVVGKNPRVLKSDRHDAGFYRGMWETILAGKASGTASWRIAAKTVRSITRR